MSDDEHTTNGSVDGDYPYIAFWRRGEDKDDSLFSDWTVVLTSSENEDKIETYYVHRLHLRNSNYFKTLLTMPGRVREHKEQTSHISLCGEKMLVFPFILDYLYGVSNLDCVGDRAVALLSLARYFDIETLIEDTDKYITTLVSNTTTLKNEFTGNGKGEVYSFMLSEAITYGEDDAAKILLKACAMEYAFSNAHVRSIIMKRIPSTTTVEVLELSNEKLRKFFNKLIRKDNTAEDSDKEVKKYKKTWQRMSVSGAGVEAVNGDYGYTGCINNLSTYSKIAMWNGNDEIFSIDYYADDCFWISIRKRKGTEQSDFDFYRTEEANRTVANIDSAIWCVGCDGIEPAPTVCKHNDV